MSTDSPRYMRCNTLNHLVKSHIRTSHAVIEADLVNKIVYDDPAVFRHLHIDHIARNFVTTCAASFYAMNTEDISILMGVGE